MRGKTDGQMDGMDRHQVHYLPDSPSIVKFKILKRCALRHEMTNGQEKPVEGRKSFFQISDGEIYSLYAVSIPK